jgi:hypothetical protein
MRLKGGRCDLLRAAAVALPVLIVGSVSAAELTSTVSTSGIGVLNKCRSWLVFKSCNSYSKVVLPGRISIGDKLPLTFGSNTKNYMFPVAGIRREGDSCKILSAASRSSEDDENIIIALCPAIN